MSGGCEGKPLVSAWQALMTKSPPHPAVPSFGNWVESVFQHPVQEPEWWWAENAIRPLDPDQAPGPALRLFTKLLETASAMAPYDDAEVAQGLWFLFDTSCSAYTTLLRRQELPRTARERFVKALPLLYRDLFAVRCAPVMGHPTADSLNGTCYMLLDLSEALQPHPDDEPMDELCLATMEQVLRTPHVACQDSAIHGLGHWADSYPARVASIIDRYLQDNPAVPADLRDYALSAKTGKVE